MADRLTELLAPEAGERRAEKGRNAALRQHHGEGREKFTQPLRGRFFVVNLPHRPPLPSSPLAVYGETALASQLAGVKIP